MGEILRAKVKLPRLFRPAWQFILLAALAFPVAAQTPSLHSAPTATAAEHVEDPLGRNTPRGTITGFNLAVYRNDFVSAGRYMQVSAAQRPNTEALARDLTELMDRYFIHPLTTVSNSPEGAFNDGLPLDRDRVGPLTIGDKNIDIVLVRIIDPKAGPIWLISSETLAQVPALSKSIGETWVERFMPKALVRYSLFENSLALWIVWAGLIGISLVLLWLLSGLFMLVVRTTIRDPARRRVVDSWYVALRWPLILFLTPIVQLAAIPFLGFSFRFRIVNGQFAAIWLVAALAWLLCRLLTPTFRQARIMVQRRGYGGTTSLMVLGERVLKVFIALVAIFAILKLAGIDTTTALAGVGIGGVAVALGAQKSVENLLGGIFLLTDKALAVGDTCFISNRFGTVEDITLRSVRLRTQEQTLLSIPAGVLSQANIENFATRYKMLWQTTLRLRYGTTAEQLKTVLEGIRGLLAQQPKLELETSRIRLVDFGVYAIELELFAYILTSDGLTFLSVREDLLLQIAAIVESSGSGFAQPTQFIYLDGKSVAEVPIAHSDSQERAQLSEANAEHPADNKTIGKRTT